MKNNDTAKVPEHVRDNIKYIKNHTQKEESYKNIDIRLTLKALHQSTRYKQEDDLKFVLDNILSKEWVNEKIRFEGISKTKDIKEYNIEWIDTTLGEMRYKSIINFCAEHVKSVNNLNALQEDIRYFRYLSLSDYFSGLFPGDLNHRGTEKAVVNVKDEDKTINSNIEFLSKPLFWQKSIHTSNKGCVVIRDESIKRRLPLASYIYEGKQIGGLLCHLYCSTNLWIIPIYSGWISDLTGVVLIHTTNKEITYIQSNNCPMYYESKQNMQNICNSLLTTINSTIENSSHKIKTAYIAGQRVNYGHTIINDMVLYHKAHSLIEDNKGYIILGNYDYTQTLHAINAKGVNKISNILTLEEFKDKDNHYSFVGMMVCPLTSYRPHSESLRTIWSLLDGNSSKKEEAIYLSLDNRKGSRYMHNKKEMLEIIETKYLKNSNNKLIVDGLTSVPNYRRNKEGKLEEFHNDELTSLDPALKALFREKENIILIDGLPFHEKIKACSHYRFKLSITPYGSSMMFPIYILNAKTFICGHEIFKNNIEHWRWHVTKYCHIDRQLMEEYLDSVVIASNGYLVDLRKLEDILVST